MADHLKGLLEVMSLMGTDVFRLDVVVWRLAGFQCPRLMADPHQREKLKGIA